MSNETFDEEIKIILSNGFGVPDDNQVGMFKHFCRFSFRARQLSSGLGDKTYAEAIAIKKKITNSKYINVSVKINVYSNLEHIDFLYDNQKVKPDTIAMTCHRILQWYVTRSEAEALGRIRNLASLQDRKLHGLIYRLRIRYLKEQLSRDKKILRNIFDGILAYVLPEGMRGAICKFSPKKNMQYPVGYIFNYRKDGRYNTLQCCPNV